MLTIEQLTKAYAGRPVLRGVDLHVAPGQIVGLLGGNGAGKTTLISIAAGLLRADGGRVRLAGVDALRDPRRASRHLGLAPQQLGIYPTLTVAGNLTLFARLAGVPARRVRTRVGEVADQLGLTPQLRQLASRLSGGQQRRLHTGMAVLHRPDVLFLDEPTVGADVAARTGILDVVRDLAAGGAAVVYTTHYLTELERLRAHIAVLHGGRIVVDAPLDDVVARYATASVALRFAGTAPELAGWRVDGDSLLPIGPTEDPARTAATALATLGPRGRELTGVEIVPANLESAYLALTADASTQSREGEQHALVA